MTEIAELKSTISVMKGESEQQEKELESCKEEIRALRSSNEQSGSESGSETTAMEVEHQIQPDVLESYKNEILRLQESNNHLSEQLKLEHQRRASIFEDFDRERTRLQRLKKLRVKMRSKERRAMREHRRRSSILGGVECEFNAMVKECQQQMDENSNLKKDLRESKGKFDDMEEKNKQQAKTIDNCKDENKELQKSMKQLSSKLNWEIEDLENKIKDMKNQSEVRLDGPEGGVKDIGDLKKEIATLRSSNEELIRSLDLKDVEYRSLITRLEEGEPGSTISTEATTVDDKESCDLMARAKRKRIEK